jgi:phosphatidylserine decarboxylase
LLALLGAAAAAALVTRPLLLPAVAAAAGAVAFAFRDPERTAARPPDLALAAADGLVIDTATVWDDYWREEMVEVAVFLALWDVHVQRSPLAGVVVARRRTPGGYSPAMTRTATHTNNRLATYLRTPAGPCTVTQISGLVARRIVSWAPPGTELARGERLGMIKFGSQTTVRLPAGSLPLVHKGDAVRAGLTPIARLPGA